MPHKSYQTLGRILDAEHKSSVGLGIGCHTKGTKVWVAYGMPNKNKNMLSVENEMP